MHPILYDWASDQVEPSPKYTYHHYGTRYCNSQMALILGVQSLRREVGNSGRQ